MTACGFNRWLSWLACQLGQSLADDAVGIACTTRTRYIIPQTRCSSWKIRMSSNIHVTAWLSAIRIRFTLSPTGVRWNREITPVERVCVPLQSDPNLSQRWSFLSHELQDKLVFFSAVYLYQVPSFVVAPPFSIRLRFDLTAHPVTVSSKLSPTRRTVTWKRNAYFSLQVIHAVEKMSRIRNCKITFFLAHREIEFS